MQLHSRTNQLGRSLSSRRVPQDGNIVFISLQFVGNPNEMNVCDLLCFARAQKELFLNYFNKREVGDVGAEDGGGFKLLLSPQKEIE